MQKLTKSDIPIIISQKEMLLLGKIKHIYIFRAKKFVVGHDRERVTK